MNDFPTKKEQEAIALSKVLSYWCLAMPVILDGAPFTFKNHEYLIDIYNSDASIEIYKKAAQMGITTKAMLGNIHKGNFLYPHGVLYLFPTKVDVTEFSKSRFNRLISENPIFKSWIKDTDSASIKALGKGFFYFRGMKVRESVKSIPVDKITFDEYDEHIPATAREMKLFVSPELILERMSHSNFKHEEYISTPTLPDFGIDLLYQASDQKHFFIKCHFCNTWTCLEEEFVAREGEEQKVLYFSVKLGRVIKACKKCGTELHRIGHGHIEWVPKVTKEGVPSGWWISQLNSPKVAAAKILEQYEIHVLKTRKPITGRPNPQEFWNNKIGQAWVHASARLTTEQIEKCCGNIQIQNYDPGPCSMGVDQGKDLHVVIISWKKDVPVILFLGIFLEWEELDYYMKAFHVSCCVVDALPETRNAKKFAARFEGKVFINYYDSNRKGNYSWNEKDYVVREDRTESLDESHSWLANQKIILPANESFEMQEFIKHCKNVAKKLIEDEVSGSKRYIYIKLGADHFMHAFNYACIASIKTLDYAFVDISERDMVQSTMQSANSDWDF